MKVLFWIGLFILQMTFVQNALAMTKAMTLRNILQIYSTFQLANEVGTAAVKEATSLKSEWRNIENEILNETSAQLGWTAFGESLREAVDMIKIPHADYPEWWLWP